MSKPIPPPVSTELKIAITDYRNTEIALIAARKRLGHAILADRAAGVRQLDICKAADFTREHIRKLAAAAQEEDNQ